MFEKVKNFVSTKKKLVVGVGSGVAVTLGSALPVLASETGTANSALTGALTSTANDMTATLNAILPIALPIMGLIVVVMLGVRFFKRVAK